jgi:SURF4 family
MSSLRNCANIVAGPGLEEFLADLIHLLCNSYRYLPAIGRFLIVVTFIEDALRIITQWKDQLLYLHDYRHSMFYRQLTLSCV